MHKHKRSQTQPADWAETINHKGCDFCNSERTATWRHFARDTVMVEGLPHVSVGDWAVCDDCHRLLEAGDREGLVNHAVEALWKKPNIREVFGAGGELAKQALREGIESSHSAYYRSRLNRTPELLHQK